MKREDVVLVAASGTDGRVGATNLPRARLLTLAFASVAATLVWTANADAALWHNQLSGTTSELYNVSCPTVSTCYAVGNSGTIIVTTNEGSSWTGQSSGTSSGLYAISCPDASTCYAAGKNGALIATTNGGTSWEDRSWGTSSWIHGISCPSTSVCFAVGGSSAIMATTNGGSNWTSQSSGTSQYFMDISCPTTLVCYAVSASGGIVATNNGGSNWSSQPSGTTEWLDAISCPTTSACVVVNRNGHIIATTNAGSSWTSQSSGTTNALAGVSCPSALTCYVVGSNGTVIATSNGGSSWTSEFSGSLQWLGGVSCTPIANCWAVGDKGTVLVNTLRSGTTTSPSESCTSPTVGVADGFAGSTYVRLRIQQVEPDETWICFRAQDGSSNLGGGRVVVTAPTASADPPTDDGAFNACSTTSGNQVPGMHPQLSGEIGDPNDPPHAPYLVDSFADEDEAWFCLRVGDVQKRVIVPAPGAQAPDVQLLLDSPPVSAPDPEQPPVGFASRTCQDGVGGDHDRALNSDVGNDMHVWLESWRPSASQAHLCVRLEGPIGIGGALSFDATGSPGVTPVLTPGDSMDPCPINVFNNDQADVEIRRSAQGSNPASVCVRQGGTAKSLTVGTSGSLVPPAVTWTPDPGTPVGPLP